MIFVYTKGGYRHCFAELLLVNWFLKYVLKKNGPWGIKGEYVSFLPASISPAVKSFTPFTGLYMARLLINQRNVARSFLNWTCPTLNKTPQSVSNQRNPRTST